MIIIFGLIIVLFLILFKISTRPRTEKEEVNAAHEYVSTEEFFKVMDVMLTHDIIDYETYTKLCVKMGAYIK